MIATTTRAAAPVRPALPADADGIVALLDTVAREGNLGVPGAPRRPAEERAALSAIPPDMGGTWVAVAASKPAAIPGPEAEAVVGHLLAARGPSPYRDHVAEIAVAVARGYRGRGLGGALLDRSLRWAEAYGLVKVCASVFADNEPALRLFASRGFAPEGTRHGQFRIRGVSRDEVFLARFLG